MLASGVALHSIDRPRFLSPNMNFYFAFDYECGLKKFEVA